MNERQAFIDHILANPEDDTCRLVFADWLEEHHESERAEFIRVQIALTKTTQYESWECKVCSARPDEDGRIEHGRGCYRLFEDGGGFEYAEETMEYKTLQEIIQRLIDKIADPILNLIWPSWNEKEYLTEPILDINVIDRSNPNGKKIGKLNLDRGFIQSIECKLSDWLQHGPTICREHPVQSVRITDRNPFTYWDHEANRDGWGWHFTNDEGLESFLPVVLIPFFAKVVTGTRYRGRYCYYASPEAAHSDLSQAYIQWARQTKPIQVGGKTNFDDMKAKVLEMQNHTRLLLGLPPTDEIEPINLSDGFNPLSNPLQEVQSTCWTRCGIRLSCNGDCPNK